MHRLLLTAVLSATLAATVGPEALALEIGKPVPDFSLPAATGETISLRQFRGKKIVLLEFFGAAFAPT
jgi:cytochrome oxidase Cu insertion factor (SCO1/SenC/PrrC family)